MLSSENGTDGGVQLLVSFSNINQILDFQVLEYLFFTFVQRQLKITIECQSR